MPSNTSIALSDWIDDPRIVPAFSDTVEFAIGDVHGHLDLLDAALEAIGRCAAEAGPARCHLTFLGDLIDRGPASVACLKRALSSPADLGVGSVTRLLGNHEQFLLCFLKGDWRIRLWLQNGAHTLFKELGHDAQAILGAEERERLAFWGDSPQAASRHATGVVRALLREGLGDDVVRGVEAMVSHRRSGNLLFVHAGIDPYVTPDECLAHPGDVYPSAADERRHWCWIRKPFLWNKAETFSDPTVPGGILVVHGHTPEPDMECYTDSRSDVPHRLAFGRLNLDGGSYKSGVVAAAQIERGRYRIILASRT